MFVPEAPKTLGEAGLSKTQACDMILRLLYLQGVVTAEEVAGQLCLAVDLVTEPLQALLVDNCVIEIGGRSAGSGQASRRFQLSELGRSRAREAFDQCRYVGPAPVSLSEYAESCRQQRVGAECCSADMLREAFGNLVITDEIIDELGSAVCGGGPIYLHGSAGNGKTTIAKTIGQMLHNMGGEIFVPYAIQVEGLIVTVFDPTVHVISSRQKQADVESQRDAGESTSAEKSEDAGAGDSSGWDARWCRVRRPMVVTGGELTLEMLELRHNARSNFYHAPLHIKANGGMFLMDDFGRQLASSQELLNRWVLPLEEKGDFLTLASGKKFSVPFETLAVFSSNRSPSELRDDAFGRRVRHKIEVQRPGRKQFAKMFLRACEGHKLSVAKADVYALFDQHFSSSPDAASADWRQPRASDVRDIIEMCVSMSEYRRQPVSLTPELLEEAGRRVCGGFERVAA